MKAPQPKNGSPPQWAIRFFRWYCNDHLYEAVLGDMLELYARRCSRMKKWKADGWFIWSVVQFLQPFAFKKKSRSTHSNYIAMLTHILLIAFRNFRKFKASFLINLIGLSTGLACALLIYLWVTDEFSMDKFHENDNRLYQVMQNKKSAEGVRTLEWTPGPLADALVKELPEIEKAVAVMSYTWFPKFKLSTNEKINIKSVGQFVGNDFFNMFSYEVIQGDKNALFVDKNAVVISESLALQLFNSTENIIGEVLEWKSAGLAGLGIVSGIFSDVPSNSIQQFDFALSMELFKDFAPRFKGSWEASAPDTYILLVEGTDANFLGEKIMGFIRSKQENLDVSLFIRPYSDRYLYGNYENGVQHGGRIEYVRHFSILAIFILCIACINFTNLSTARATRRAKEVGIKKAVGASRKALIFQYLVESVVLAFLSLLMALAIVVIFLPVFNNITGKAISMDPDVNLVLSATGIAIVTGLLAGSYPALYISGFRPAGILRGQLRTTMGGLWARKGLVIFQFVVSVVLIVVVIVVYEQTSFIQTKNLGYEKDNIIYLESEGMEGEKLESFLSEVRNISGVSNASSTTHTMRGTYMTTSNLNWVGKEAEDISFENIEVNYDMLETMGIVMADGRSFSKDYGDEHAKIIFNETAIRLMGMENPVGKKVILEGKEKEIIGIATDFHLESLYENIKPMFFILNERQARIIPIKIQGLDLTTIDRIRKFYESFFPNARFEYQFMDENYQALYVSERRISILSKYFAALAILISCLGLLGLSAFTAERKMKETGIKKIFGAGVSGIVFGLSADFTKIILVAIIMALPASYFIAKSWLDSFAYRIDLEWWFFASAGGMVLVIAWMIVGWQTYKVANINPVECLKEE